MIKDKIDRPCDNFQAQQQAVLKRVIPLISEHTSFLSN
jgi:hypothetical protein